MVQNEARRQEEEGRRSQAVSQGVQGAWTKWEQACERKITWKEMWSWTPLRTQFLLKSVYDLLPTPVNLKRWGKESEEKCGLCSKRGTLSHVLSGCSVALGQGRYRWRHDRVLRVLAITLEEERTKKRLRRQKGPKFVGFVKEGEKVRARGNKDFVEEGGILPTADDWALQVDLDRRLNFPEVIVETRLRPDAVLWSVRTKQVVMIELTVPWEDRLEEAHERKLQKYQELKQECANKGWKVWCFPIEVGCRGFVSRSTWSALGALGIKGRKRTATVRKLEEAAETSSRWVFAKSRDTTWKNSNAE